MTAHPEESQRWLLGSIADVTAGSAGSATEIPRAAGLRADAADVAGHIAVARSLVSIVAGTAAHRLDVFFLGSRRAGQVL